MIVSSAMTKIFNENDCVPFHQGACLCNQGFQFQIVLEKQARQLEKIEIISDLKSFTTVYRVFNQKGNYEHPLNKKTDDYYIKSDDDTYPDLLQKIEFVSTNENELCVLLIDISERKKPSGTHSISIKIGNEIATVPLQVYEQELVDTDLLLTNWFHLDGICQYYNVEIFSQAFYERLSSFLDAYVRMGNTMILIPAFTPPLDTEVGKERLTTQLVNVYKEGDHYRFDFSEMKRFLDLLREKGIKYFEHSHLFTQWGGEYCPKIMVEENGKKENLFGWAVTSDNEKYQVFLQQYLNALQEFLRAENLLASFYLHLTDEPKPQHLERYQKLSAFVKRHAKDLKTIDALSEKEIADAVDMPAVAMFSKDLPLFDENKMLYYCVEVETDCITNRYFHMPLQRTEILGFQLYETPCKGFLHWGYNFYNTQLSKATVNPYQDATAGGGFPAGDSFIVYPGETETELSVRYFSIKRAFEDYRLLKTLEQKIGKEETLHLLHQEGVHGVHAYPKSVIWHENFRKKIMLSCVLDE